MRLLEPSYHKVIYAREANVDWRQLVASQLHEIGKTAVPKVSDSRTYDLECLRQVVADYPDSVADQETAFRTLTRRSRATFFRLKKALGDIGTAQAQWEPIRMYPTHMANHFQKRRLEMHLSLTQLASWSATGTCPRATARSTTFERTGCAIPSCSPS